MRMDLNALNTDAVTSDVCVVGAGAAGIALAQSLLGANLQVVLVESGTADPHDSTEALNESVNVGSSTLDTRSSRRRLIGGTTRIWAGQCVPLDPGDLDVRSWVPGSGWPLSSAELVPHYRRAERLMDIEGATYGYGDAVWPAFRMRPPPLDSGQLRHHVTVWPRRIDLGQITAEAFSDSSDLRVLTNATAVRIITDDDACRVEGVDVRSLEGAGAVVRARAVVLCAGTIENARLLLSSDDIRPAGLGNGHDLVGRYLQEHPNGRAATVHGARVRYLQDHYALLYRRGRRYLPRLSLAPDVQAREQVLNCTSVLVFDHDESRGVGAAKHALRAFRARDARAVGRGATGTLRDAPELASIAWRRFARGRSPASPPIRTVLQVFAEQAPIADSRVTLARKRDALGVRMPEIDWRLSELDGRTVRAMVRTVGAEMARLGLGTVEPDPWVQTDRPERCGALRDSYHHIGTTRMATDPRHGVVDRDGRVHDIAGLYVAGASVFPTSGWANPTLTAMALSMRLGDHLKAELS